MPYKIVALLLLIFSQLAQADVATGKSAKNALYLHASPYLAMHGRDPVHWHEWNKATMQLARKQNKLLFVSSGYFSCHWCHVMQRESYQNDAIAKLLNENFIPVKVDRELTPALDAHLIDFVSRTQGISGWPLNVFVTPDGYPLVGMVYVPPENFREILTKLTNEWKVNRSGLLRMAKAASEELSPARPATSRQLPDDLAKRLSKAFTNKVFSFSDDLQGGFGQENKFPSVPQLYTLLEVHAKQPDEKIKSFLITTLDSMAKLGLRDQLGGGFYRYVVDPGWQVPHFEKMLYDNALLATLYFRAGKLLNQPLYTEVALDTVHFMLRDLATNSGALAASLSAVDDKGIEGGYYLWDKNELSTLLSTDERRVVEKFWQLEGLPDLEDGHHLVQAMSLQQLATTLNSDIAVVQQQLASARQKMHAARNKRTLPKDNKKLAAWNGLALTALVDAVRYSGDKEARQSAEKIVNFITRSLWDGTHLYRVHTSEKSTSKAGLEDYAYVIQGLYDWWQLTGNTETKSFVKMLIDEAWKRFYTQHGWILAEDMLLKYGHGEAVIADGPMPSPSAVLVNMTLEYAVSVGDAPLRERALQALNSSRDEILNDAFWFATQIRTIVLLQGLAGNNQSE